VGWNKICLEEWHYHRPVLWCRCCTPHLYGLGISCGRQCHDPILCNTETYCLVLLLVCLLLLWCSLNIQLLYANLLPIGQGREPIAEWRVYPAGNFKSNGYGNYFWDLRYEASSFYFSIDLHSEKHQLTGHGDSWETRILYPVERSWRCIGCCRWWLDIYLHSHYESLSVGWLSNLIWIWPRNGLANGKNFPMPTFV
jgi:hypothetical protein